MAWLRDEAFLPIIHIGYGTCAIGFYTHGNFTITQVRRVWKGWLLSLTSTLHSLGGWVGLLRSARQTG